ncbi:50S ribosomal protein L21 [Aquimarina sp. MMG015]|uniref:50S ribosomal protein L21 n=1 Tax=Aquimarina TaxID=290174 RepID=UPI00041E2F9F|nr:MULTISPECIES: 50S ribosomal protein L21 [Aquimarina]AXT57003.1 50S ribosomal protein L21 [Aquimarina sp. AD1]MBQ4801752.1 50S ribosomal protein L21 [Aquimarina sp. MMG015]RKN36925.1 50S ribosomal protein L21 [Aquimarina sp. AD1]
MYAIVEIAGQQFKVAKDQKVFVHRLAGEEGDKVSFDKVLLTADGDKVTLGAPAIDGAQVGAKITRHLRGDKVIVFKKKRRKGYRVKNGHRQSLTEIVIESIVASGAKKAAPKKEAKKAAPKTEKKVEAKVAAPKKEEAPKKAAPKKSAKADDLKKIEGIGPKIAETLKANGIVTFADLSKADPKQIAEFIKDVRGNHVPDTWPKQAEMAADGKWDELKEWQDKLDGGIEK